MLDLRQIQYFVCLYEERSVTRAARRLNVVQPALSMQINRLERQLAIGLFERTARGMIPTSAGEAVYRLYLPILLDLKHADQKLMELSGKVLGKISVGIIPSVTNSVLADVLRLFGAQYPDVEIRIDEAYSGTLVDWVMAGDLDFAIVNGTRRKAGATMRPLIDEELVLLERGTQKSNLAPIPFKRLSEIALVLPSRRHGIRSIVDDAAAKAVLSLLDDKWAQYSIALSLKFLHRGRLTAIIRGR